MAPRFDKSSIQLDYPPVSLDFDSQDANRIVVGGGGGPRRDVKNKIVRLRLPSSDLWLIAITDCPRDIQSNRPPSRRRTRTLLRRRLRYLPRYRLP